MILDWAELCSRIYETRALLRDDPSDNKQYRKQEAVFIRYLHLVHGLSPEDCYATWASLANGTAATFANDPNAQRLTFTAIWYQAFTTYAGVDCVHHLKPIAIFTSELEYLNSLPVPRWIRQYWGALLFYYKFAVQVNTRVPKTSTVINWCLRQTERRSAVYGGDHHCQEQIWKSAHTLPDRVILDSPGTKDLPVATYKPAFLAETGSVCYRANSLTEVGGFLSLITAPSRTCTCCGAAFEVNSKTKRQLCPTCY